MTDEIDALFKDRDDRELYHKRLYDKMFPESFWRMLEIRLKEMELSRSKMTKEVKQNDR